MANYKNLPKNTPLFTYDQLPDKIKPVAINNFLKVSAEIIDILKKRYMDKTDNIHQKVNAKNRLADIVGAIIQLKKHRVDKDELVRTILGNVLMFTKDGIYVTYSF